MTVILWRRWRDTLRLLAFSVRWSANSEKAALLETPRSESLSFRPLRRTLFEGPNLPFSGKQKDPSYRTGLFCFGGDGEIRTLETVLRFTRFPVVRPRPD